MAGTFSIYKYCKTDSGWRYCKAAFHSNGKIKPNVVIVSSVEEKHTEGRYFLNFNSQWIDVGLDALEAQRRRQLRLNQIEYERLSGKSRAATSLGPSVIEFAGRKIIKDEVEAYIANLELAKRPHKTVQSRQRCGTCGGQQLPTNSRAAAIYVRDDGKWKRAFHARAAIVDPKGTLATSVDRQQALNEDNARPTNRYARTDPMLAVERNVWEAWRAHDAKKLADLTARNISFINIFGVYPATKTDAMQD
jgi:hypothetical protein